MSNEFTLIKAKPEGVTNINELFDLLCEKSLIFSVAESFTAGRVTSNIISIPGASKIFHEGIVAYSNQAKQSRLFVKEQTLSSYGAVSAECCLEMILGLLRGGADVGVATTGIAGPKSDNTSKPVGLCYIGVGDKSKQVIYEFNLCGSREEITQTAVDQAIIRAVEFIKKEK